MCSEHKFWLCPLLALAICVGAYGLYAHFNNQRKEEGQMFSQCRPTPETAAYIVGLGLGLAFEELVIEEALSYYTRWQLKRRLHNSAISSVHAALQHTQDHHKKILAHQHDLVPSITVGEPVSEVLQELFYFECW